jgi:hypothetical protein
MTTFRRCPALESRQDAAQRSQEFLVFLWYQDVLSAHCDAVGAGTGASSTSHWLHVIEQA